MRRFALLLVLLPIAGCDKGVDLTNASVEDVAAASRGVQKQQPGQWEITTAVEDFDTSALAGNPDEAALLKRQLGQKQVTKICVTRDVANTSTFGDLGQLKGSACRFDRFAIAGGKLDAAMHCTRPEGSLTVTQTGSYTATAYDLRSTVKQDAAASPTSMTMHMVGRHLGDCPG